jgi:hypothetical protein
VRHALITETIKLGEYHLLSAGLGSSFDLNTIHSAHEDMYNPLTCPSIPELRNFAALTVSAKNVLCNPADVGKVAPSEVVGADVNSGRPFGAVSDRDALDSKKCGLLLDTAAIGDHKSCILGEREKIYIPDRVYDLHIRTRCVAEPKLL